MKFTFLNSELHNVSTHLFFHTRQTEVNIALEAVESVDARIDDSLPMAITAVARSTVELSTHLGPEAEWLSALLALYADGLQIPQQFFIFSGTKSAMFS